MTAHGSRRTAFFLVFLAAALLGWWLWPRHPANASALAKTPGAARAGATSGAAAASSRDDATWARRDVVPASGMADRGNDVACRSAGRTRLRGIRDALDPSRSAREAFAHALLGEALSLDTPPDEDAQRRDAIRLEAEWQAARSRWPNDLDIAWQAAGNCTAKLGCSEGEALDHLLQLDPGNAAAWWLAMQEAWDRGDIAAYDEALAHAAASRGSDTRTGSVFLALQPLLAAVPQRDGCIPADDAADLAKVLGRVPTAADLASVETWSYELASNSLAPYSAFSGCREHEAGRLSKQRRADCTAALSVLADGDTLIEQSVALPLLIQLEGDSAEGLASRERYRRTLYLFLATPPALRFSDPADLLSVGEVEAMRRAAIARHRWPPPADWLPAAPRQRMLVTHGTLPPDER